MSKAFVKEDGYGEATPIPHRELVPASKNHMTNQGLARFKQEFAELQNERSQLAAVPTASSEPRVHEIDYRLEFLQDRIESAQVIVPEEQRGDRVLFGATVTVLDERERTRVYKVVGVDETDAKAGKISWISPVGKALLQARVGDTVTLQTPRGEEELEVKAIEFKPIDAEPAHASNIVRDVDRVG